MVDCIGKVIKVVLLNGFYYKGKVLREDGDFYYLIDINSRDVTINKKSISTMEVLG